MSRTEARELGVARVTQPGLLRLRDVTGASLAKARLSAEPPDVLK